MDRRSLIEQLRTRRQSERDALDGILSRAKHDERNLTAGEATLFDTHEEEIRAINDRVEELENAQHMDEAAAPMSARYGAATRNNSGESRMTGSAYITSESAVYSPESRHSFFLDLARATGGADGDAKRRLDRHAQESRALSTTNGQGGEFSPPGYLIDRYVEFARPSRPFADLVPTEGLPPGIDQINVPRVASGTATGTQSVQNTAVTQVDMTSASLSSPITTIAGSQVLAVQSIEQSPIRFDDVVMQDLAADYARQLDVLWLTGNGTGGNPTGVLTLAGTNAITYSGTALTGANSLYNAVMSGISAIWSKRYAAPDTIVMHPRRWAAILASVDSQSRPIVVPSAGGPVNSAGLAAAAMTGQGPVGMFAGLPVVLDASIPTTGGVGNDQDVILVLRTADLMGWESAIRAEAFPQTYAATMSVLLRLYAYNSFQPGRHPQSISVIRGTGLAAATAL
ncbi:phage major capsid protein [Streptomyces mirabilis]|uniref:phage major capsid protein n=1 Tax=Streptomyces mirabilis TaxID=68239 RepID=UPI0036767D2D